MSRTSASIEQAREPRTRRAGGRAASRRALAIALAVLAATVAAAAEDLPRTPAPDGARVYFIDLEDGAVVSSPLVVRFGLEGMGVAPAGVSQPHTGHHHLLIDADLSDSSQPVPSDEHHRHFGGGQTEVSVELSPGEHTLQLVLGDHLHIPHQPPVVSQRITVTVK